MDLVSVETAVKYAGYLRRQESEIERARKDERRRIPADFPFDRVPGLSREWSSDCRRFGPTRSVRRCGFLESRRRPSPFFRYVGSRAGLTAQVSSVGRLIAIERTATLAVIG